MAEAVAVRIEGLPEFQRALRRFAPEVHKSFRSEVRGIAKSIAQDAKGRASWSKRIPKAISPTVTTKAVGVRVSKARARHGGLYERGSKGSRGFIRHPLFGNTNYWYQTPTRPFLQPAVNARRDESLAAMLQAIDNAKRGVGLA